MYESKVVIDEAQRTELPPTTTMWFGLLLWRFIVCKSMAMQGEFEAEKPEVEVASFPRSRVGERALYLPKEQGKSLHSPLSKGRELHAPGWGPYLVSPISTCFKYFKSHSVHVCHLTELIYARLSLL
ncbi:hypothetical protein T4A_4433 [Trichinella pseudospiralis]|uniref:Uncharacterized protein n=1 Tax=Trichinella pseudospiralis TaxID=6337 RepID=A0A0V1EBC2_TRIPS|nr:hypothetical protein T4A_4433 [Trichinella pseudospiralis]